MLFLPNTRSAALHLTLLALSSVHFAVINILTLLRLIAKLEQPTNIHLYLEHGYIE